MKIIEKCRAQLAETAEARTTTHKRDSSFRADLTSLLVLLKACSPLLPILLIMHGLKINAFVFKLGSGIEVRFPVSELNAQGPESAVKTSLPSWAPML
jgi:hypothetical protein